MSVRIEGGAELARALRAIPARLAREEMRVMLRKAAHPYANRIRGTAPKGDPAAPNITDVVTGDASGGGPTQGCVLRLLPGVWLL
jgi:hypothetical protein